MEMGDDNMVSLIGKRFGKLTVIAREPNNKWREAMWKCVCDCGGKTITTGKHLRSGHTTSCGCIRIQSITKHGLHKNRLYSIYQNIKKRCYNEHNKDYSRYGGHGIIMCEEWKNDFMLFHNWAIENGYKDNLSIDRINNDGNYEPSNCRWVTMKEQAQNRSTTKNI